MSEPIVFDIETYRPDWRVKRTRREDFDPARNTITTIGVFNGEKLSISPVIENLKEERNPVQFLLGKLEEFEGSTLVGYNILHFDIPYLVYKSNSIREEVDVTRFNPLDLFWILPYWLHNIPSGRTFYDQVSHLGNLWSLSNVVKYVLRREANPFSNKDVFQLWEMKRFDDIEKHLELDLVHTYSFLKSPAMQETLNHIQKQNFNKSRCEDRCPFRQLLQKTPYTAIAYCTLSKEPTSDETDLAAIDVIDYPLPRWDVSWVPCCTDS